MELPELVEKVLLSVLVVFSWLGAIYFAMVSTGCLT
jgi:hypothetical protein